MPVSLLFERREEQNFVFVADVPFPFSRKNDHTPRTRYMKRAWIEKEATVYKQERRGQRLPARGGGEHAGIQREMTKTKEERTRDCSSGFGNSSPQYYGRVRIGLECRYALFRLAGVPAAFRKSPLRETLTFCIGSSTDSEDHGQRR